MLEKLEVSVLCTCFNHEKYLRDCLDSLINQSTTFKYEIIINDDASTDNSKKIIDEYTERYPNLIRAVFHDENQNSKGIYNVGNFLVPKARGKYLAFCECDDFWTEENKLQKQYDAVKNNQDCSICAHKVNVVQFDTKELLSCIPQNNLDTGSYDGEECIKKYCNNEQNFHYSSFFVRKNIFLEYLSWRKNNEVKPSCGDLLILLYFLSKGDLYFINESMSSYRFHVPNGWSVKNDNNVNLINSYNLLITNIEILRDSLSDKLKSYFDKLISFYEFEQNRIASEQYSLNNYSIFYALKYRSYLNHISLFDAVKKFVKHNII